jgi:hypothetical protein
MQHARSRRSGIAAALLGLALPLAGFAPGLSAQTPIRAGQTVSAQLTASSPTMDDSSHYELYTYHGRAGEHLTITLKSSAFDAYLAFGKLVNGAFDADETDDDGGGGTDAKVEVTLAADGDYAIRANTLSGGETGAYTLSVATGPAPATVPASAAARGSVRVGQTVTGSLSSADPKADDDSYYQMWNVSLRANQRVTVDLKSTAFDAYLSVGTVRNGSFNQDASDDDSGGGTDARVVFTPSSDGTYAIRVNTLSAGETGAYTLSVTEGGTPTASSSASERSSTSSTTAIVGSIRSGADVSGTLTGSDAKLGDGSYYDDYTYQGRQGERLVITLKSGAFDTFLNFGRLSGSSFTSMDTDDDGAGGTDSRIEVTLPADGTYLVRANSLSAGASGAYTLRVESTR